MKTFVISLKSEVARRNAMREQLESLRLDYEFFDAIRGSEHFDDPRWYDDASARRLEGRSLRPGEVGCALSHAAVYAEIVKRGIPWALILEDDAMLHKALPAILSAIEDGAGGQGQLISLSRCDAYVPWTKERLWGQFSIATPCLVKEGAIGQSVGYVISLDAAKAIATVNVPVKFPADSWGHYRGLVKFKGVLPTLSVVRQNTSFQSTTLPGGVRPDFVPYPMTALLMHGFLTYTYLGRWCKKIIKRVRTSKKDMNAR